MSKRAASVYRTTRLRTPSCAPRGAAVYPGPCRCAVRVPGGTRVGVYCPALRIGKSVRSTACNQCVQCLGRGGPSRRLRRAGGSRGGATLPASTKPDLHAAPIAAPESLGNGGIQISPNIPLSRSIAFHLLFSAQPPENTRLTDRPAKLLVTSVFSRSHRSRPR
jgi:hypothetical protein